MNRTRIFLDYSLSLEHGISLNDFRFRIRVFGPDVQQFDDLFLDVFWRSTREVPWRNLQCIVKMYSTSSSRAFWWQNGTGVKWKNFIDQECVESTLFNCATLLRRSPQYKKMWTHTQTDFNCNEDTLWVPKKILLKFCKGFRQGLQMKFSPT